MKGIAYVSYELSKYKAIIKLQFYIETNIL